MRAVWQTKAADSGGHTALQRVHRRKERTLYTVNMLESVWRTVTERNLSIEGQNEFPVAHGFLER